MNTHVKSKPVTFGQSESKTPKRCNLIKGNNQPTNQQKQTATLFGVYPLPCVCLHGSLSLSLSFTVLSAPKERERGKRSDDDPTLSGQREICEHLYTRPLITTPIEFLSNWRGKMGRARPVLRNEFHSLCAHREEASIAKGRNSRGNMFSFSIVSLGAALPAVSTPMCNL